LFVEQNTHSTMTQQILSTSGKKAVNITGPTADGKYAAIYVQFNCGQEQVLEAKYYKSQKQAEKYANKTLN